MVDELCQRVKLLPQKQTSIFSNSYHFGSCELKIVKYSDEAMVIML